MNNEQPSKEPDSVTVTSTPEPTVEQKQIITVPVHFMNISTASIDSESPNHYWDRGYVHTPDVNKEKRVALAYENSINISNEDHANASITNFHYIAELKLEILNPNNNVVASCTTGGANLKVLEFTPQTTGTYKIKATMTQSNTSNFSTYIGVAWQ